MYARFFRWASDRLDKDGIIAFITNRNFVDSKAFDGFRAAVAAEFNEAWVVDLGGDVRVNPKLSGTKHNVFGIQAGVAISFLVKRRNASGFRLHYTRRPEFETAEEKLSFLSDQKLSTLQMAEIVPDAQSRWLGQTDNDFDRLLPIATPATKSAPSRSGERAIFKLYSRGVATQRDDWMWDFEREVLENKVRHFTSAYAQSLGTPNKRDDIKWDRELTGYANAGIKKTFEPDRMVSGSYRPFVSKTLYYDRHFNGMTYQTRFIYGDGRVRTPAITIMGDSTGKPYFSLAIDRIPDLNFVSPASGGTQTFPIRRLSADGREADNITDWALKQFTDRYGKAAAITKDDIFAYVYAVLHDPVYRETYALNLKREFPRIPLYPDFRKWRNWGQALLDLHIGYEAVEPFALTRTDAPDPKRAEGTTPAVKLKSDPDKGVVVLDADTQLSGIPTEAWRYRLGNRSAIDWVLDQHKEKTPKDPTIREKFNTYRFADYKETVIDLLARVVTVSLQTLAITDAMSALPTSARDQKKTED
jgi:predicted helicase